MYSGQQSEAPGAGAMDHRSMRAAIAKAGIAWSGRTRHTELLILCARIGFNP